MSENDSRLKLEQHYAGCVKYWMRQEDIVNEKEAHKRALEGDLIGSYRLSGCIHNPFSPFGDELDKDTTIAFFKEKCMDLYGNQWEIHWKLYGIE